jgi:hypothetical protein
VSLDKTWCNQTVNCLFAGENATGVIQNGLNRIRDDKGGSILIKEGVYVLSTQLVLYGNTSFIGEGIDKTVLKLQDVAASWKLAGMLRATWKTGNCSYLLFKSMTLDGNKAKQVVNSSITDYGRFGLFTEVCNNVVVDSVRITSFQGYGFDPHGNKGDRFVYNLQVKNCIADNNDWDGFTLDQTIGIDVQNCTSYNNGRHGFNVVTGSRQTVIRGVTTSNNGFYYKNTVVGCGVMIQNNMLYGTARAVVRDSSLVGDAKGAVCISDVFDINIRSNYMKTPANRCIYNKASSNITITLNTCSNPKNTLYSSASGYNYTDINISNNTMVPYTNRRLSRYLMFL